MLDVADCVRYMSAVIGIFAGAGFSMTLLALKGRLRGKARLVGWLVGWLVYRRALQELLLYGVGVGKFTTLGHLIGKDGVC